MSQKQAIELKGPASSVGSVLAYLSRVLRLTQLRGKNELMEFFCGNKTSNLNFSDFFAAYKMVNKDEMTSYILYFEDHNKKYPAI